MSGASAPPAQPTQVPPAQPLPKVRVTQCPCCRNSNATFREVLREIEKQPACGGLPMISFLILPMQRVTRLPLLTDVSILWGGLGVAVAMVTHLEAPPSMLSLSSR